MVTQPGMDMTVNRRVYHEIVLQNFQVFGEEE
jgi:hypothetical protein